MSSPTITASGTDVTITWSAPYTYSSKPILAYAIYILDSTETLQTHSSCDGTDNTIMSQQYCTITMSSLRSSPYSLVEGDLI